MKKTNGCYIVFSATRQSLRVRMGMSLVILGVLVAGSATCLAQDALKMKVKFKTELQAQPFDLTEVRLLDGPFREAMLRDEKYLLSLDPDRFLHTFRVTAGLPSTAKPYGGWEAPEVELRGHSLGHYMSALALMYASTGNAALKARADTIVADLAKVREAMPSQGYHPGYLSAFPEEFFDRVDARKPVWAPYYTIHKIMAGLLDVYLHCANDQALSVLEKMADWVKFRVERLTEEQQQRALGTEYGGMNEVLANLYAVTGSPIYLDVAKEFNQKVLFDSLAVGIDPLDGLHANTQFPKIIGAAREYELTGEPQYAAIARFFWDRVALHRSYVIGGNSDNEQFFPIRNFSKHLGVSSTETCNTYNMLKLTRHLFEWNPSAREMDFYERGLYNQILASQDPATGMMTYYVPLKPGAFKTFSSPTNSFWCCVGTGMENHAKYGSTIYFHTNTSLYVNLFIPSELNWQEKGLRLRQETRFPEEDNTRLYFDCNKPVHIALNVRYPRWAQSGIKITVNGKEQTIQEKPESYVTLEREWKSGDRVDVQLPMTLHIESMPDDSSVFALLYGPIVLCGDLGNGGIDSTRQYGQYTPHLQKLEPVAIPAFVCDRSMILAGVSPVAGSPLEFRTSGVTEPGDVSLVPFYKMFNDRYTVYWRNYSADGWQNKRREDSAATAKREDIERRTVDAVRIGDRLSETAHGMQGDTTSGGMYDDLGWRESDGGWFSYDLRIVPDKVVKIVCTFQGSEQPNRIFDLLVDGQKIATQTMGDHPTGSFDVEYPVPETISKGKTKLTVRFQSEPHAVAGTVRDVRTVQ
jgi:DUF1680 family protein